MQPSSAVRKESSPPSMPRKGYPQARCSQISSARSAPRSARRSARLPLPMASMAHNAARTSPGNSSAAQPSTSVRAPSSPHCRHATRSALGSGVSPASSSSSSSNASGSSTIRSAPKAAGASAEGTAVTSTSMPESISSPTKAAKAAARCSSSGGRSANTARAAKGSTFRRSEPRVPPSRSRRKQGEAPLIQNTWRKPNTVSAYSAASIALPKPVGATRKRARRRSRKSRDTRPGRERRWRASARTGRAPRQAHWSMKRDMANSFHRPLHRAVNLKETPLPWQEAGPAR